MWEPKNPAIVGRIRPAPLTTAVAAGRAALWRNRIEVAISCSNGNATETCKGSIAIKLNGNRWRNPATRCQSTRPARCRSGALPESRP
jgi:hypothetical protein